MGVRCIKTETSALGEELIFSHQNMVKIIKDKSPYKMYNFLEKIGKGSFSDVYKAQCYKTGKLYAIKKIEKKPGQYQKMEKLILNEFYILKELDHTNIIKMYQYYEEEKFIYITIELCHGKELFDVIVENKIIREKLCKKIFQEICLAVKYMHENNVMHRDLKPENIIYDSQSGNIKIVDFGSAVQFTSSECCERRRVGTSYYIAPQILNRFYNEKCDVWSLGVILYVMLSGEPPFKGNQDDQILENVKKAPIQFKKNIWNFISEEAQHLISTMLERNIKKRKSMEEVVNDIWFMGLSGSKIDLSHKEEEQKSIEKCLTNMRKYKDMQFSPIQDGMIVLIVNFIKTNEDAGYLEKCFKALDQNGDGVLSLEELTKGISKYLKAPLKESTVIARSILQKIDKNKSGTIDYSEFLIAATNFQLIINEENIDIAFNYIDEDNNGTLTVEQIRNKLGENIAKEKYENVLKQFDKNSDGEISREQFRDMMKALLKNK